MSNSNYKVLSENITKPEIDNRIYKLIQLPNELEVLLISDKDTDKSAAALDVNIGSFHDPVALQGLAHFCEHLLFMGTKKYPSENEYSNYLSKNNGFSNAFTSSLHTNYYFEVSNDSMEGALDRFSQFFISPLFNPDCKDREINAVDSENKKNLQNDNWRFYQLTKSLTNPNHPFNKFSTGNNQTLKSQPLSENINVRDELLKFYNHNYSSNLMKLVILSNQSIDEMANWSLEKFSDVKNKNNSKPFFEESPFQSSQFVGNLVKVKPIMDQKVLQLSFPVPDNLPFWNSSPLKYLTHLIGHESKGSLLYNLKLKGWSNSLSSGSMNISPGYSLFLIDIELTEDGLINYEYIIKDVFKYLKVLKNEGIQEWIFSEIKEINEMNFKFKQKSTPSSTVSKYAGLLHNLSYYDTDLKLPKTGKIEQIPGLKQIPYDKFLNYHNMKDYEPETILKFLNYLNPENFKVNLVQKGFSEEECNLNEKWYNTEYGISKINEVLMSSLNEIYYEGKNLDDDYKLPEKNEFIATDFSIIKDEHEPENKNENEGSKKECSKQHPTLIKSNKNLLVWFKNSTDLSGPRSSIAIKFNLPSSSSTPLNSSLLALFIELLEDELNSMAYLASMAGLSQGFNVARDGISLELYGYSHKIGILLSRLIEVLIRFVKSTDSSAEISMWDEKRFKRFEILKEKTLRNLKNFGYSVPYNQVGPMISGLINENAWLVDDQIESYNRITYSNLKSFVSNLFGVCQLEFLIIGNIDRATCLSFSNEIENKFFSSDDPKSNSISSPLSNSQFTRGRSLDLTKGKNYHFVKPNVDSQNINSCVEMFIQTGEIGKSSRDRLFTDLISQIIHEPFFNRLRTQEQLGYVVFSGLRETRTTFGLRLLVQSERSTTYLMKRISKFLNEKMRKFLNEELTQEEFKKHVNAVIQKKLLKAKNLKEEKSRYWTRISTGFYDFNRRLDDVRILEEIELKEIVEFYNNKILNNEENGKLVVHLVSQCVPVVKKSQFVYASISNYCYSKDIEIGSITDLVKLVEENVTDDMNIEDTEIVSKLFEDKETLTKFLEIIPEFKAAKPDLVEYISKEAKIDYNHLSIEKNTDYLIDNIGDFKSRVPLTAAAYPLVDLENLTQDTLVSSKL